MAVPSGNRLVCHIAGASRFSKFHLQISIERNDQELAFIALSVGEVRKLVGKLEESIEKAASRNVVRGFGDDRYPGQP